MGQVRYEKEPRVEPIRLGMSLALLKPKGLFGVDPWFRVFRVVTGCVRVVSRDVARCRKTPSDLGRIDEAAGVGRFI